MIRIFFRSNFWSCFIIFHNQFYFFKTKRCNQKSNWRIYSIISDYIGRPVQAFDKTGSLIWETDYDIYGRLRNLQGEKKFIPFRQLGQYEDEELEGLYYNRFRYYDCNIGGYISLAGARRIACEDLNNLALLFGYPKRFILIRNMKQI